MQSERHVGKTVTIVGAILFLLVAAALSFSLYGEVLDKTKAAVLMLCATVSAFILFVGQYLEWVQAKSNKHGEPVKKTIVDS